MKDLYPVLAILKKNKGFLLLAVLLMTVSSFIEASSILSISPIIDYLINQEGENTSKITSLIIEWGRYFGFPISIFSLMGFFLTMILLKNISSAISKFVLIKLHFRLVENVIFDIYRTFMASSWQFFVENNPGVLANTLLKENEKIGLAFEAVTTIISNLLRISFYLMVAFFISWKVTLIVALLLGTSLIPFYFLGSITYKAGRINTSESNRFQGIILETFNGAKLILGYGKQSTSIDILSRCIEPYIKASITFVMVRIITPLTFEPIAMAIVLLAVYLGVNKFTLTAPEIMVMLWALRTTSTLAIQITDQKNALQHFVPSVKQIYRLKGEAKKLQQFSGDQNFEKIFNDIKLENVSFSYSNDQLVLKNICIEIPKGKMVAIVGNSGAGKTTIIDILMGFYDVTGGRLLIDGINLTELDMVSWRQKIGFVPQDSFMFNLSVKDNLIWSNETASDEDIASACEAANATEFIEKMPKGIETIVGDRGVRLSGGQRQRLALARALLRKPELLILDEATSALDSHSELMIQKSIENISHTTTILVIAHRLSTIKKADIIYVLENGEVVEKGPFDQLMSLKSGSFFKAAELQGIKKDDYVGIL